MSGKTGLGTAAAVIGALVIGSPALSQIGGLPDLRGVGALPGQVLGEVGRATRPLVGEVTGEASRLLDLRQTRLDRLLRGNRDVLELDPAGDLALRGQVLAISPSPGAIERARTLGFTVLRQAEHAEIGVAVVTLATPRGMRNAAAIEALRRADPEGSYEYDHLYFESGAARAITQPSPARVGHGPNVGLIDGGADPSHPALAGGIVEQRGFSRAGVKPSLHGTAVASLIRRSAPGARLYVADIYGGAPEGGSATSLASALNWMAEVRPAAVNISLVGPPNRLLQASIEGLAKKGVLVVAAVGNDGPAAPPAYPASYPQVVAVTGVDRRNRVLTEAGKALHLDFAAPGANLTAAAPGGGDKAVRGTSFAAPIVAGKLAAAHGQGGRAVDLVAANALDLGAKGPDPVYGRGVVGADLQK